MGHKSKKCLLWHTRERKCFFCEKALTFDSATVDHVIPLSLGGSKKVVNLELSCRTCNLEKGNTMPQNEYKIYYDETGRKYFGRQQND